MNSETLIEVSDPRCEDSMEKKGDVGALLARALEKQLRIAANLALKLGMAPEVLKRAINYEYVKVVDEATRDRPFKETAATLGMGDKYVRQLLHNDRSVESSERFKRDILFAIRDLAMQEQGKSSFTAQEVALAYTKRKGSGTDEYEEGETLETAVYKVLRNLSDNPSMWGIDRLAKNDRRFVVVDYPPSTVAQSKEQATRQFAYKLILLHPILETFSRVLTSERKDLPVIEGKYFVVNNRSIKPEHKREFVEKFFQLLMIIIAAGEDGYKREEVIAVMDRLTELSRHNAVETVETLYLLSLCNLGENENKRNNADPKTSAAKANKKSKRV